LFESIEISDFDEDDSETPEVDEEEKVEFEPRADGVSPENSDEVDEDSKRDEIDEMLEDDRRFFRSVILF